MRSLNAKRRVALVAAEIVLVACGSMLWFAGNHAWLPVWLPYSGSVKKIGITIIVVAILYLLLLIMCLLLHHGWFKGGYQYFIRHYRIERCLENSLQDAGIFVKRFSGEEEVALLPKIKIVLDENLRTGEIKIQRRLKEGHRLEDFDISSALDKYIVEQSYISKDGNYYLYDIFNASYDRQLVFQNTSEYIEMCAEADENTLVIDAITAVPLHHSLICGQTGSGKSYFLNALILQMLNKSVKYNLYFADPKRSGLAVVGEAVNAETTADTIDGIIEKLKVFHSSLKERMNVMKVLLSSGQNVDASYKDFGLEPYVFVFDEYLAFAQALGNYKKDVRDDVNSMLSEIILMGRQCGFFLWLIMQSAPSTQIPTFIRDQLVWKVVLGNSDRSTYTVTFDAAADVPVMKFPIGYGVYTYSGMVDKPKVLAAPTIKDFDILPTIREMKKVPAPACKDGVGTEPKKPFLYIEEED